MPLDEHQQRRSDDRDRELNNRLELIEKQYQDLSQKVTIVQVEQSHLKDLFTAKLGEISKGQEFVVAQMATLSKDVLAMAGDADKSPAGRELLREIETLKETAKGMGKTVGEHEKWKDHIDGVLGIMKWVGAGGLLALGLSILRLLKLLP